MKDSDLAAVAVELDKGLVDADLGGGLVKKRLARQGQGKRGGHRVILAFRRSDRSIFMFGFTKSDRANLEPDEQETYKMLAKTYLEMSMADLETLCANKILFEV